MATQNSEKLIALLEKLHYKYQDISEQLLLPEVINNRLKLKKLSKEIAYLKPLDEKYQRYHTLSKELKDAQELIEISEDEEMAELAKAEVLELTNTLETLTEKIKESIAADADDEARDVFLEIRAGAGGNEASLFASDLLRMYARISELKGWKSDIINTTYSAIGGIKEISLHIKGNNVNKYLQYEMGVHRVQRVPETESSGRIHTSTVTVAVIPEIDDVEVTIDPKDLRVDTFSASGPGGQHVNKCQSAIRITHIPTSIVVSCQDEKSQHKNKAKAMKVLKSRIYEKEKQKQEESISNNRKSQVGSGDRSEKIRTYNFPQSRVTDHRITGQNFNIETILDGSLEKLYEQLIKINTANRINEKIENLLTQ